MIQYIRSLIFLFTTYFGLLVIGIVFAPFALFWREAAFMACRSFCMWVRWSAVWMVGLRTEVRGPIPTGDVIIAAKHQSFLDILMIFQAVPRARFIMKRELLRTPIVGMYAKRIGCVPVDRSKGGAALSRMVKDVATNDGDTGQLVIYPQGTRVPPGDTPPFRSGISVLYSQLNQPCFLAATNVGMFWPRRGIMKQPGLGIVEFLDPIPAGRPRAEFMAEIESRIEAKSNELMREAGFKFNAGD